MKIIGNILTRVTNQDIVDGIFIIPDGVTRIESGAFFNCSNLAEIVIPESVASIRRGAFFCCSNLTSVKIPASVISIGENAFLNCYRLMEVIFAEDSKCTSIGEYAFNSCFRLTNVKIPASVIGIEKYAFQFCIRLTSVTFAKGSKCVSIGDCAFDECHNLKNIIIPNSIMDIGKCAFNECCDLISKQANYKAFSIEDNELICRDKVYKEGEPATVKGKLELCNNGIHYCTNLFEIFNYYSGEIDKDIAVYEIEVGDEILTSTGNSSKCCTNSCTLKKRLYREDIIRILNGDTE